MTEVPETASSRSQLSFSAIPSVEAANTAGIKPKSSLLFNSVAMGAANILSRGIGYISIILMARRIDVRYMGAYAILLTTSMLVDLVSNLGLDKIVIREIASSPVDIGKGYFWAAVPIRLATALVSGGSAWVLLSVFYKGLLLATPLSIGLFLAAIFPVIGARNCEAFLTAHERLLPIAVAQVSEKIVIFGAVLLLIYGAVSFSGLLCFAPLASLMRFVIVAACTVQSWTKKIVAKRPQVRLFIGQAVQLFSVEVLALVYFRCDVFLLAKMGGLRETGIYQITYKIFDFCLSLFTGFLQAVFPRMVRNKSRKTLKVMLAGGVGLLSVPVAIIILGRHMILGALRPDYVSGSTSLVWLMLTVPLVYLNSALANAAIAAGRVKLLMGLAGLLIVSNVGLNLVLIPRWSMNGAAFSTFACELLSALAFAPFILKSLPAFSE